MATTISQDHIHTCDLEQLFSVYVRKDWLTQRYEGIGMRNVYVDRCEKDGDTWHIWTRREVQANIPRALRKFAGEWNLLVQKETWVQKANLYVAEIVVDIESLPVDVTGQLTLKATPTGSVNEVRMQVSCKAPLIGRIAEKFVSHDTGVSIDKEYNWIKSFLSKEA